MAQAWYTVPESKIWRTADGKKNFWFYEGDPIPMETAVEFAMPGAALPDPDPHFTADEQAAIIALITTHGGGGGGETYPMNGGIWYDNSTAMAGMEGDDQATLEPDTITLSLIRITDPDADLTGVGIVLYQTQSGDATARFALFAVSETGASRGLAGAKVADLGTVLVTDGALPGDGFSLSPDAPVTPGLYWLGGSATATVGILGFRSYGGTAGRASFTDGSSVSAAGLVVASTGAHTAMPSTLVGVVEPDDLTQEAARFFFQVTPTEPGG